MSVEKKKEFIKKQISEQHGCSVPCVECTKKFQRIDIMEGAHIPVGYWLLNLKDFHETSKIKDVVKEYTDHLNEQYLNGKSICFAGTQGTGKTMGSIIILKKAIANGFSVFYVTANDLLQEVLNSNYDIQFQMKNTDFLVIDELDSRFFYSENSKQLFGGIFENIYRQRAHNGLPTILCSNETDNIMNTFSGQCVQSIESLNSQYLTIYPITGTDYRKRRE